MQKKTKEYSEIELIKMFGLSRFTGNNASPLMIKWTDTDTKLSVSEQEIFDFIYGNMVKNIVGWQEEDLKMQFISFVLYLGHLQSTDKYLNFYEKTKPFLSLYSTFCQKPAVPSTIKTLFGLCSFRSNKLLISPSVFRLSPNGIVAKTALFASDFSRKRKPELATT